MTDSLSSTFTGTVRCVNEKGFKLDGHDSKRARALALKRASYLRHRETEIARKRAKYLENREQEAAHKKARYLENPEPARARAAAWRAAADPVALAATQRAYREKNKERLQAQHREYYQRNKEQRKAYIRQWQQERADARRAYLRAYQEENRDRLNSQTAAYKRANRDRVRAWNSRRDALKRGAPINDLTAGQWTALKRAYRQRCGYCGSKPSALTMDHYVPLIRRGPHTARNILPSCKPCNLRKNAGPPLPVMILPRWAELVAIFGEAR